MELLAKKAETKTAVIGGITFEFRTKVTSGDRFEINTGGALTKDGIVSFNPLELYRVVCRLFVVGWEGVTEGGKPVLYSFETLTTRLPELPGQDIIIQLGTKIAEETGIFKASVAEADLKNG